jgi:hypothetical protein
MLEMVHTDNDVTVALIRRSELSTRKFVAYSATYCLNVMKV